MERIDIKLHDTQNEKYTEVYQFYFELEDKFLRKVWEIKAETMNENLLTWSQVYCNKEAIVLKSQFSNIWKCWRSETRNWQITIGFNGSEPLTAFFLKEKEAVAFKNKILEWALS